VTAARVAQTRRRLFAPVLAIAVLAGHLFVLASALDDIDAVNFALGARSFDVAAHQPHPPGYPVYVGLARLSAPIAPLLGGGPAAREARGLAIWSAILGALLVFPLLALFRAIDGPNWRAPAATLVTVTAPLVWFSTSRPMSDVPGLALATLSQALSAGLVFPQGGQPEGGAARSDRMLVAAALVAGLALGLRSQAAWLTLPLLVVALVQQVRRGRWPAAGASVLAVAAGVLAWLVPMVVASGGPAAYLAALGSQAGEDLAGVTMLALNPRPRVLAGALFDTAIRPWVSLPLGCTVVALAVVGAAVLAARDRRALALAALIWAPYAAFHLLFQETVTTRYALPLVPAMAYLAVRGASAAGTIVGAGASVALGAAGLALTVPALAQYASDGGPVARAAADVRRTAVSQPHQLAMHLTFARALRGEPFAPTALPSPDKREWLELVRYWRQGGTRPVWFLADPRRTDLNLVDPASRQLRAAYRWPPRVTPHLHGARPAALDWWTISPPGWVLGEGWSLTAEVAGVASVDRRGPALGGATAHVRRRPGGATLLLGGRNLGAAGTAPVRFAIDVDGAPLDAFDVPPSPGFFLRTWPLPPGALAGEGLAALTVRAAPTDGSAAPARASVEQFDLQPEGSIVWGYDEGWYEPEYDPARGRAWRWASGRAGLRVAGASRDLAVRIEAEDPARYGGGPVEVALEADGTGLARVTPAGDFSIEAHVPAAAWARDGRIVLTTSRTFVPATRGEGADARELALRVYRVVIVPR
jgi:hypothetical protein